MSAPDTNIEKQTRRHKASLWGIAAAITAVVIVGFVVFNWDGLPSADQAAREPGAAEATQ